SSRAGWICLAMIFSHPLSWRYLFLVKPHALGIVALALGYLFSQWEPKDERHRFLLSLLSGLFFGIAVNTRLLFLFAVLVPIVPIVRKPKLLLSFLLGFGIPSLPSLYYLIRYPDEAFF